MQSIVNPPAAVPGLESRALFRRELAWFSGQGYRERICRPDADGAVVRRCDNRFAVETETCRTDRTGMFLQRHEFAAVVDIPDARRAIVRGGDQPLAVGAEGDVGCNTRVAAKDVPQGARAGVPDLQRLIGGRGGKQAAVAAERGRDDRRGASTKRHLPSAPVCESQLGLRHLAIGIVFRELELILCALCAGRRRNVEQQRLIAVSRQQVFSIGTEQQRIA